MKNWNIKTIVILGLLTALEVVLSRFVSFNAWNMKIGTSFIPIALTAVMFGPVAAGIVGALGDFIGAILFPIGAYFPGFTLTAFLVGVLYGLLLRKRKFIYTAMAVAIDQFVLSLFLNTLWISILYGSSYAALLGTRIIQVAVMTACELICIPLIIKLADRVGNKILN